jgi:hypothetical protein
VSHPIRTDSDRTRVLEHARDTLIAFLAKPGTVNDVRDHMILRINDGIRAAAYDGDPGRSSDEWTPTERAALLRKGDAAHDDLAAFDADVLALAKMMDRWTGWGHRYPSWDSKARRELEGREPGKGTAPSHLCQVCWLHGKERERYGGTGTWCPSCAQFHRTYGQRPTVRAVWEILHIRGHVPLSDLRRLWPEVARKVSA